MIYETAIYIYFVLRIEKQCLRNLLFLKPIILGYLAPHSKWILGDISKEKKLNIPVFKVMKQSNLQSKDLIANHTGWSDRL